MNNYIFGATSRQNTKKIWTLNVKHVHSAELSKLSKQAKNTNTIIYTDSKCIQILPLNLFYKHTNSI